MKQCQECGTFCKDDTLFCNVCGNRFPIITGTVTDDDNSDLQEPEAATNDDKADENDTDITQTTVNKPEETGQNNLDNAEQLNTEITAEEERHLKLCEETYQNAIRLSNKEEITGLVQSILAFESIGDYKDSKQRIQEVQKRINELESNPPSDIPDSEQQPEEKKGVITPVIIILCAFLILGGIFFVVNSRNSSQSSAYQSYESDYDSSYDSDQSSEYTDESDNSLVSDNSSNNEEVKHGTVFFASNTKYKNVNVRTSPSTSGTDTGQNIYEGDRVTVYEIVTAEGYTWYRIGEDRWIAGDGTTFGVKFD